MISSSAERCLLSSLSSDAIRWKGRPNFRHHLQLAAELVNGLLRVLEEFPQDDDHWALPLLLLRLLVAARRLFTSREMLRRLDLASLPEKAP